MAKYKVMSSVGEGKEFYNGIDFDYVIEDETIGISVNCLGGNFKITQNGKILVLANDDWVLTIMSQEVPKEIKAITFEVNKDWDMFFEDKTFRVYESPATRNGVTYKEFFEAVKKEWELVSALRPEPLPLRYDDEMKQIIFINEWSWGQDDYMFLRDGSWGTENEQGRSV